MKLNKLSHAMIVGSEPKIPQQEVLKTVRGMASKMLRESNYLEAVKKQKAK